MGANETFVLQPICLGDIKANLLAKCYSGIQVGHGFEFCL